MKKESDQKSKISSLYELKTERKVASLELIDFEERKTTNVILSFTEKGDLFLSLTFFNEDEVEVLKGVDSPFEVEVKVWDGGQGKDTSKEFTKELTLGSDDPVCFRSTFAARTIYSLKMRMTSQGMSTQWSDETEFSTPKFKDLCVWKECPDDVEKKRKYSVDEGNPRVATKIGGYCYCTIIGNTPLPHNKVTSWSIKMLKSKGDDGRCIYIGIAPSDINQNENHNYNKCGWYFDCYGSTLDSGPPHNYSGKEYGPRKKDGEYIHTGDSVGVVMDTAKGELSFVVNGVDHGVAFDGIPLDKPLVPCILLYFEGDFVELVI